MNKKNFIHSYIRARIYKSSQKNFECLRLDTKELVIARAKGNLLKKNESIVVGDYVFIEHIESINEYEIKEREERTSEIYRYIVRESKKKVTAANIDYLIILMSLSRPAYKQGLLDRFLVRASQWEIEPIVIFNKMDELDLKKVDLDFERQRLDYLNISSFCISAKFPEKIYLDEKSSMNGLKDKIEGKTAIFLGQSGVGKSKTISELSGGKFELKTHSVGKAGKGSHTTTWSEIISFNNFEIIDSPGIRSLSLEDINPEELIENFPDLNQISVRCKFNNCEHDENSKGCRFWMNDTYKSEEEEKIIKSRLESYHRILLEVSETPVWSKKT